MSKYTELKSEEPICEKCFFAFTGEQYASGKEKSGIGADEKIYSAGQGLYGTKEGIEKFLGFYEERSKRISAECNPQEVYDHEYWNHECGYVGNDEEAIKIVIRYFGVERAKTVKRKYAWVNIDEVDTKNLFS